MSIKDFIDTFLLVKTRCTDCGKRLWKISYVRRLRPGEPHYFYRDPLCKHCWEADNKGVESRIALSRE